MKKLLGMIIIIIGLFALYEMKDAVRPHAAPPKVSTTLGYPCPEAADRLDENGVRWFQTALNRCIEQEGLEAEPLEVDGQFGPLSQQTTAVFQRAAGLTDDGCLNAATVQTMITVLDDDKTGITVSSLTEEDSSVKWTLETGTDRLRITKNDGPDGPDLTVDCCTCETPNSRSATVTITDSEGGTHQINLTRTTPED